MFISLHPHLFSLNKAIHGYFQESYGHIYIINYLKQDESYKNTQRRG